MNVRELIEQLSGQPGDYEVHVRFIDHDERTEEWNVVTGIADVVNLDRFHDARSPGYVILNYEDNETGELREGIDPDVEYWKAGMPEI